MAKTKKRIAMIFPYAPSYRESIYRLVDEQFDCTFFFCGNSNRGLKYMDYHKLRKIDTTLREDFKGPFRFYDGISKLDLSGFDVVIHPGTLRNPSSWYLNLKIHFLKKRPRVAIWTHGWYGKESRFEMFLKRVYFKFVDTIFVYGNYARQGLIKSGISESKIVTIYNSLDYDSQKIIRDKIQPTPIYQDHFKNTNPVIIMIGRLNIRKKLDMLIEAIAALQNRGENYNIMFIGDGEDREKLETLASKLGVADKVWFYGACFDEKTNAELLYNADLCIIPGDIGLTAIHAMTLGVPVITHNCFKYQGPEFEAIIPGITGDFFDHDNMTSFIDSISNWFKINSQRRDSVRNACYEEVTKHWTPQVQLDILKKTL